MNKWGLWDSNFGSAYNNACPCKLEKKIKGHDDIDTKGEREKVRDRQQ